MGIAALEAGLHVLVEKPISVHKADCERLIAAHKDKKLVFAAMFNQRTDPRYKKIKNIIDTGQLGEITRVNWIVTDWFRTHAYYSSGSWRATWKGEGGGVLLNQCPHQLDLLQWLAGMPAKVCAFCRFGARHDIEVEDEVTAYLEYPGGATGVFITSTGEAPGTNRLEICGEMGKIVVEKEEVRFWRNEQGSLEFSKTTTEGFAKPEIWDINIPVKGLGGQHKEILENFADAILEGKELIAPAREGIHSVELANAMLYSSLKGCAVELPIDGMEFEKELNELIKNSKIVKG
jgi:predicted dehydrogenase